MKKNIDTSAQNADLLNQVREELKGEDISESLKNQLFYRKEFLNLFTQNILQESEKDKLMTHFFAFSNKDQDAYINTITDKKFFTTCNDKQKDKLIEFINTLELESHKTSVITEIFKWCTLQQKDNLIEIIEKMQHDADKKQSISIVFASSNDTHKNRLINVIHGMKNKVLKEGLIESISKECSEAQKKKLEKTVHGHHSASVMKNQSMSMSPEK